MEPASPSGNIAADIAGDVHGQVAVGNYNVQVHAEHGAVVHVAAADAGPRYQPRSRPVRLLPRPFPGLLDREGELGATESSLDAAVTVELVAAPGGGKTSLLRHLAHRPRPGSPDGVVYLPVRGRARGDLVQELFEAFHSSDVPRHVSPVEARHALQEVRALLLLDDVELDRDELEAVLDTAPSATAVVTTARRSLWGEVRSLEVSGLPDDAAAALLERELGRPLAGAEGDAAAALVAALAGHPLRLLQAAALTRSEGIPLSEVAARLGADAAEAPARLARQVADGVEGRGRRVLGVLAAFAGLWLRAEQVAALTGDGELDAVLVDICRRGAARASVDRYGLAETVAGEIEAGDVGARAVAHFADWAEAETDPRAIVREREVLLRALELGAEAGSAADVVRLARAIDAALLLAPRWASWQQVLAAALTAARALGDRATEAWALHQRGSSAVCLGDRAVAEAELGRAIALRDELGLADGAAVSRHNLGLVTGAAPGAETTSIASQPVRPPEPRAVRGRRAGWLPYAAGGVLLVLGALGGRELLVEPERTPAPTPTSVASHLPTPASPLPRTKASTPATPPPPATPTPTPATTGQAMPTPTPATAAQPTPTPTPQIPIASTPPTPPTPTPVPKRAGAAYDQLVLDFGAGKPNHESAPLRLTVTSTGSGPLWIHGVRIAGDDQKHFDLRSTDCIGRSLPHDATCEVAVVFSPKSTGAHTAPLVIDDDAPSGGGHVTLRGVAVTASIAIEPRVLAFLPVERGQQTTRRVRVSNPGDVALQVTAVAIASGDAFKLDGDCAGTIPAGEWCELEVTFRPPGTDRYRTLLWVDHDASDEPSEVSLSGSGRAPPRPEIAVRQPPIDFGEVLVNEVAEETVTVWSTGTAPATLSGWDLEGRHRRSFDVIDDADCRRQLADGESCELLVSFAPRWPRPHSAKLVLRHAGGVATVELSGIGEAPAANPTVTPDPIRFDTVTVGRPVLPITVTIGNDGTGPMTVRSVDLVGRRFSADENCIGEVIEPGQTCAFAVGYNPRKPGEHSAELVISYHPGGRDAVELSGRAELPEKRAPVKEPGRPDLVVSDMSAGEPVPRPDGNFDVPVSVTVENVGDAAAAVFKVALALEHGVAPFQVDGQPDRWYPRTSRELVAGRTDTFQGVTVLHGATGSTVTVTAVADSCAGEEFARPYCRVDEVDEGNNQRAVPVIMPKRRPGMVPLPGLDETPRFDRDTGDPRRPRWESRPERQPQPLPDLVVDVVQTGRAAKRREGGYAVPVEVTVGNVGQATAGRFQVALDIGGAQVWFAAAGEGMPYLRSRGDLGARRSVEFRGDALVSAAHLKMGRLILTATADSCAGIEFAQEHCLVAESDEGNNHGAVPLDLSKTFTPGERKPNRRRDGRKR